MFELAAFRNDHHGIFLIFGVERVQAEICVLSGRREIKESRVFGVVLKNSHIRSRRCSSRGVADRKP
jgi:hypothetical protein